MNFELVVGNVHDNQSFHQLYEKLDLTKTKIVALDAGYKTPSVLRKNFLSGKLPAIPYTRPMTKDGFFRKSEYVYDEYFDCYICPQNQILKYTTTTREGYREYKSDPTDLCYLSFSFKMYFKQKSYKSCYQSYLG